MSDQTMIEKAIQTGGQQPGVVPGDGTLHGGITAGTGEVSGGLLQPEQSNRFIDYIWDATTLLQTARTIRMRSDTQELDKVAVGERLLTIATEATDTGVNAKAKFTKISLSTTKLRLDWEISTESLEDNIEGEGLEDHIARLMATQVGNDLEDLAINGKGSGTGLLSAYQGWKELVENGSVNAVGATPPVASGQLTTGITAGRYINLTTPQNLEKNVLNAALKALPRKYKARRSELRFYTGSNAIQDYMYKLTQIGAGGSPEDIASGIINGANAVGGPAGGTYPYAFGIPLVEVPLVDESSGQGWLELTFPNNRVVGIKRDITVYREFKPKKDTIEHTLYLRTGVAIENPDAYVIVDGIDVANPVP